MFDNPCLRFSFFFFFGGGGGGWGGGCFVRAISSRTLIPLFTPGIVHSGLASGDVCDKVFPDELRVSSFLDRVPTLCLDSGIVSPLRLRLVKGV